MATHSTLSNALVVGSGPAGMASALALLEAGVSVTMLDVGLRLESKGEASLRQLQAIPASEWRRDGHTAFLTEGMTADLSGVPLKLAYGSDYPYRSVPVATPVECRNSYLGVSLALGGLSTTWGSSMLPYIQADMGGWPITSQDLAPHYEAVLRSVPTMGSDDDLTEFFPLYTTPTAPRTSRQAQRLLANLKTNKDKLRRAGIVAGSSRIAVDQQKGRGCIQCGLCMFGCPEEIIYSSAMTVAKLMVNPNFHYVSNVYVEKVHESGSDVIVFGKHATTGEDLSFRGDRVFLGAGTVNTTQILLRSLGAYDRPVTLLDSDYFLQPSLSLRGVPDVRKEALHTLTQAFIEIMDPEVSANTVHLQIYTYNELFEQALRSAVGKAHHLLPKAAMLGRLLLIQGFIHSSESASMVCTLRATEKGDVLHVEGQGHTHSSQVVKRIQRKLMSVVHLTGLVPLLPLLRVGDPGRSFHLGGTFPMRANPVEFETSTLGVPVGMTRVHAIDSTIFPSVTATTITLASMANAHRIATLAASL